MRELLRILILIAALCTAAIGLLTGVTGIAFSLLGGGPETLLPVTLSASVLVLSLGLGWASAWHAWRAIQGCPSAAFRPTRTWPLVLLFLSALVLGQAVLSLSIMPVLAFPLLHIAASVLPALFVVAVVGRALGGVTTWRDMVLQTSCGAFLAALAAFALEAVAILLITMAAIVGLALQPGGQELLVTLTSHLQDPTWLQDPDLLAPALLTPATMAATLVLVAVLIPLIEEAVKTIGVGLMSYRRPSPAQAVLWGLAAGAGFSIAEGLLNSATGLGAWLPTVLLRVGTTLLHCMTGALMGLAWHQLLSRRRWLRSLGLYLLSVTIHGLWNGLALVVLWLSLTSHGTNTASSSQLTASLGMLGVLFLLGIVSLGMAGGLAALTARVRRQLPPPEPLGERAIGTTPAATSSDNPENEA